MGIKDVRVKLYRLSREEINRIITSLRTPKIQTEIKIYGLRHKKESERVRKRVVNNAVSVISVETQKRNLWLNCKKIANKFVLIEGALVMAKQNGYPPWPSTIEFINKSRTSATVKYLGFSNLTGNIKLSEIVPIDMHSMETVGALINFTIKTPRIRDFGSFQKAVAEIDAIMKVRLFTWNLFVVDVCYIHCYDILNVKLLFSSFKTEREIKGNRWTCIYEKIKRIIIIRSLA